MSMNTKLATTDDITVIRLLIVDDLPGVRRGLSSLLPLAAEVMNLQIEIVGQAADGLEALQLAEALRPDVILMDLEMPRMDGFTAARRLRQICPGSRLAAMSIHTGAEVQSQTLAAGFDVFIEKGLPVEQVIRSLYPPHLTGENQK